MFHRRRRWGCSVNSSNSTKTGRKTRTANVSGGCVSSLVGRKGDSAVLGSPSSGQKNVVRVSGLRSAHSWLRSASVEQISTRPLNRNCWRVSGSQHDAAACALADSSTILALRESLVIQIAPVSSNRRGMTDRTWGCPERSTVAKASTTGRGASVEMAVRKSSIHPSLMPGTISSVARARQTR